MDPREGMPGIEVEGLVQGYGKNTVLDGLNMRLPGRGVVGLVGPNGAGKTTLIRTIATLMAPRAGTVTIGGHRADSREGIDRIRRRLGYLPQGFTADDSLTVTDFVRYCLWMRGADDTAEPAATAIDKVGLAGAATKRLRELSGGMRQRAGLAAAIAGDPSLIILDEPTAGLDPSQRSAFRKIMRTLGDSLVLFSTHLIEDIHSLATDLVVMGEGAIKYHGHPSVLAPTGDASIDALEAAYHRLVAGHE